MRKRCGRTKLKMLVHYDQKQAELGSSVSLEGPLAQIVNPTPYLNSLGPGNPFDSLLASARMRLARPGRGSESDGTIL